jgi:hypothetical protein
MAWCALQGGGPLQVGSGTTAQPAYLSSPAPRVHLPPCVLQGGGPLQVGSGTTTQRAVRRPFASFLAAVLTEIDPCGVCVLVKKY